MYVCMYVFYYKIRIQTFYKLTAHINMRNGIKGMGLS